MPQVKNPYVRGHLYIEFDVNFPDNKQLTESTKKILKTVLPPPANVNEVMSDVQPEEVTLVTVDFDQEKRKFEQQESEAHEEDDPRESRGGGGHGQPQCRQQ